MSTIFACFDPDTPVAESTIAAMLTASDYWRPDAGSFAASPDGHCRMARAALFNTAQSKLEAVHSDDASNMISANARLDNRAELAEALGIDVDTLAAMSDGALILAAYRQWGEACPAHLLGDFAFIIWDAAKRRLFCARDHFGVKVLFYARTRFGWMVTNEHNALFAEQAMEKRVDEAWLAEELWGVGPSAFTSPFVGIEVLAPAHSMIIDASGSNPSRYWSLEDKSDWDGVDDEALIEALKLRFEQAVRVRLESEYPLAAELSEGLDSNGIAGFAARMLGEQPLHTLSYGCDKLTDDNRHIWEKTYEDIFGMHAMHDNIRPVWRTATEEECRQQQQDQENLQRHAMGGLPVGIGGNTHHCRLASATGARVLLSGWGGDHCVSTYGDFYESELLKAGRLVTLHRLLKQKYARERCGRPAKAWAHLLLKHAAPPLYRRRLRRRGGLERAQHERAAMHPLKEAFIARYRLRHKLRQFTDNYQRYSVKAHHRRELFDVGVENRLVGSELAARMFRIEYRYPMLDVPLVELAYNMPSHLKVYNGIERYMFRRIFEGVTTERIQWRVKADVSHPQIDHNKKDLSDNLVQQLRDSRLAQTYCDPDRLQQLASHESALFLLSSYQLLLDIEQQFGSGDAVITDAG